MFDLAIAGKGTKQIAEILEAEKVLIPSAVSDLRAGRKPRRPPYNWNNNTVRLMLRSREYAGYTVSFKTYSKSYKLKKRLHTDPANLLLIPNTQEAIVSEAQWERVQELLDKKRRPAKSPEKQGLFAGLVYCANCGNRLYYHASPKGTTSKESYYCGTYSLGRKECTAHYIREAVLREIVQKQIQSMMVFMFADTVDFEEEWMDHQTKKQEKELRQVQKHLAQAKKRSDEIDDLLMRTYEDYTKGILTLERYQKMSAKYEQEQRDLTAEIDRLKEIMLHQQTESDNFERFKKLVYKYIGMTELTPTVINEFVQKIIVHEADKSSGKRVQQVEVIFNFVGPLDLPGINEPVTVTKGFSEKIA